MPRPSSISCRAGNSIQSGLAWSVSPEICRRTGGLHTMDVRGAEMIAEMELTGEMLIGSRTVRGTHGSSRATNPATGAEMEPVFGEGTADDVDVACTLAEAAFNPFRALGGEKRAQFLESIAQGILDLGDVLIERVMAES